MVKCGECGFYSTRHAPSGSLTEVPYEWRVDKPDLRTGRDTPYMYFPVCGVRAKRLHDETSERTATELWKIGKLERTCDRWTEWHIGFTPKEHREMLDRDRILDREERRDKEQRDWQRTESASNKRWRLAEFLVACVTAIILIVTVMVIRGSQPTVQIITEGETSVVEK